MMPGISFSNRKLGAQILWVIFGKGLGFIIAMLTNIIIIRQLGPEEYGVFAIGVAILLLLYGIVGEALDFGVLKYVPFYLQQDENTAWQTFSLIFKLKLIIGVFLVALSFLLGGYVAQSMLKNSDLSRILTLSVIGVFGMLMMKSVTTYLQALERFTSFLLVELSHTLLKFVFIILLLYAGLFTAFNSLIIFTIVPFLVFICVIKIVPKNYLKLTKLNKNTTLSIIHYTKWVMLSFGLSAIHSRLDIFMIGTFHGSGDVGIYSSALALAMVPEIVASFASTVFYPKIMPLYRGGFFKEYFIKSIKYTVPLCILAITLAFGMAETIIELFYTKQYMTSIPILQILVIGYIFWWLITPLASAFLFMVRPTICICLDAATLIFVLVMNAIVIPQYGPLGAAWVSLVTKVTVGSIILWFTFKLLGEMPPPSGHLFDITKS